MRWWLLRTFAAWCGLKVGLVSSRKKDGAPLLVVFSRCDALTLEAIGILVTAFKTPQSDSQIHREWLQ